MFFSDRFKFIWHDVIWWNFGGARGFWNQRSDDVIEILAPGTLIYATRLYSHVAEVSVRSRLKFWILSDLPPSIFYHFMKKFFDTTWEFISDSESPLKWNSELIFSWFAFCLDNNSATIGHVFYATLKILYC